MMNEENVVDIPDLSDLLGKEKTMVNVDGFFNK